jgi:hypothetical protein
MPPRTKRFWESHSQTLWTVATVAGAITAIGTLVTVAVNIYQIRANEEARIEEDRKVSIGDWQATIIYTILERSPTKSLSFSEIQAEYVKEAVILEQFEIPKIELQPLALRRLLLLLSQSGAIALQDDGKYLLQRTILNPRFNRSFVEDGAKYKILQLLTTDGGKYDSNGLSQHAIDKFGLSAEEASKVLNELAAFRMIVTDENGRIWSALNVPSEPKM